jgi:hypothetical protein
VETISYQEYEKLLTGPMGDWYNGRWSYYGPAIEMIKTIKYESAIELGPGKLTMIKNCDVMVKPDDDFWGKPDSSEHNIIFHNATEKPWPIINRKYDLFIALQVWEHLNNKQCLAFREVKRISKKALLSFPYMWDCPKNDPNYPEHHMIDKEIIGDWTLNIKPKKIIEIERTSSKVSRGPRLIYYWEFE